MVFPSGPVFLIRFNCEQSHREEVDRIKRDLSFANERAEDATRNKSSEVSGMLSKYNRQLTELEDSLRVRTRESLCEVNLTDFSYR